MKMATVSFQIPKDVDEYFRSEGQRRMCSKSVVMREVLAAAARGNTTLRVDNRSRETTGKAA
jgi:hypothetical protein